MSLIHILRFIANHPLNKNRKASALLSFLRWQVGSRLIPGQVIFTWIGGSRVIVTPGETGLTQNIYCGLHDFSEMAYTLHVVTSDDIFVDVGANVGAYTILACAVRGAKGFCFEPIPETCRRLSDNIRLNELSTRVQVLNMGLSDEEEALMFTTGENCMNHVVADGEQSTGLAQVRVCSLDVALNGTCPSVLKIDVEGFETKVLRGAEKTLGNPQLHSIIIELKGHGDRYGFDEKQILDLMHSHGFLMFEYKPFSRELVHVNRTNPDGNTLFIRDRTTIISRLANAPRVTIAGLTF